MNASNDTDDVKIERELRLPPELDEAFPVTFARLRRMFRARGVPTEEAADLAQETITRALLHLNRRRSVTADEPQHDCLDPLLNRIAQNRLIDHARAISPQLLPIEGAEYVSATQPDPSDEVARRQQRAQVHRAIDELAARHRTAMLLSLEGLTPAEIAEHLGIRRNAADALLYRARKSLARNLSAIAGLIRGVAVLVALKLRSAGRRAGEVTRVGELATVGGQTLLGVTAATLGAALSFAPQPAATIGGVPAAMPPVHAAGHEIGLDREAAPDHRSIVENDVTRRGAPVATTTEVDPHEHRISTGATFDDDGEDKSMELDIWHDRDEDDRGAVGPVMDDTTGTACGLAPACDLGGNGS